MEEIDFKTLEQIPVPEDLEERLSKKIDEWEARERRRIRLRRFGAVGSIAAAIAVGIFILHPTGIPSGQVDTYSDPRLAYEETERALNLLATNINRCQQEINKIEAISEHAEEIINKNLQITEK